MILLRGSAFGEVIASLLESRQEYWTKDMEIIAAGGIADGASNVQAAGRFLYGDDENGDDIEHCQNHLLKGVYEMVEKSFGRLQNDLAALTDLFVGVSASGNVSQILKSYRYLHEISTTALYIGNETRWEGSMRAETSRFPSCSSRVFSNTSIM